MKKWARARSGLLLSVILALMLMIGGVGILEAEAYTITYHITVRVTKNKKKKKKKKKKPYIDTKKLSLYKCEYYDIILKRAKGKKVKWSASNKCVSLKKHGNRVRVTYRKKGTCYVRAKYKGKTYKCKIICEGPYQNAVKLDKKSIEFTSMSEQDVGINFDWPGDITSTVENSNIVSSKWGEYDDDGNIPLTITPKNPGKTRIRITNTYNPSEVDYIEVKVNPKTVDVTLLSIDDEIDVEIDDPYSEYETANIYDYYKLGINTIHAKADSPNIVKLELVRAQDEPYHWGGTDYVLRVYPKKIGRTRIRITNDWNPYESEYFFVNVVPYRNPFLDSSD